MSLIYFFIYFEDVMCLLISINWLNKDNIVLEHIGSHIVPTKKVKISHIMCRKQGGLEGKAIEFQYALQFPIQRHILIGLIKNLST